MKVYRSVLRGEGNGYYILLVHSQFVNVHYTIVHYTIVHYNYWYIHNGKCLRNCLNKVEITQINLKAIPE